MHSQRTLTVLLTLFPALLSIPAHALIAHDLPPSDGLGAHPRRSVRRDDPENSLPPPTTPDAPDRDRASGRTITLTSHEDFCVFGPGESGQKVGSGNVVSWCSKSGEGVRQIPQGTMGGVTFIKADNWVQVSGTGDLTQLNIGADDLGGQLDSGAHRPDGARVLVNGQEAGAWVSMISGDTFCFRACIGDPAFCPTDLAERGCYVLLSNAVGWSGAFQTCHSADGRPPIEQGDTAPEWRDCWGSDNGSGSGGGGGGEDHAQPAPNGDPSSATAHEYVPRETCVPCDAPAPAPAPTSQAEDWGAPLPPPPEPTPPPVPSGPDAPPEPPQGDPRESAEEPWTMQHGVTQVGAANFGDALFQELEPGSSATEYDGEASISAPVSAPTPTLPPVDDALLDRRWAGAPPGRGLIADAKAKAKRGGGETITRDGLCCYTTWLPQAPTPTAPSPLASASTGGTAPGGDGERGPATGDTLITATGVVSSPSGATPTLGGTLSASATGTGVNGTGVVNANTTHVNATGRPNGTGPGGVNGTEDDLGFESGAGRVGLGMGQGVITLCAEVLAVRGGAVVMAVSVGWIAMGGWSLL